MHRRILPCLLLAPLAGCPPETRDSAAACVPDGDSVSAGVYGGVHYQLTVGADGAAELLGDCSRATVDSVPVSGGTVHWTLTWQSGYGLPVQDTASITYIDVVLDATYCGGEITGTLTFPDTTTSDIDVVLGESAEIYACQ